MGCDARLCKSVLQERRRRAERTWGMWGDRCLGLVSIMDPENPASLRVCTAPGRGWGRTAVPLCHISTNVGLHRAAVFMKLPLPHSLERWQELTQGLLAPTFNRPFSVASSRVLRAAAFPPARHVLPEPVWETGGHGSRVPKVWSLHG